MKMKRRETLRSFFIRNSAWRLQRYLTSAIHPGRERKKEIIREQLENYKRLHAVTL
jgi:hypothetical protein